MIVALFDSQVDLSKAVTFKIPFESISKVTTIWVTPLLAGNIPDKLNSPNKWLSLVISLSPSKNLIVTDSWLSE